MKLKMNPWKATCKTTRWAEQRRALLMPMRLAPTLVLRAKASPIVRRWTIRRLPPTANGRPLDQPWLSSACLPSSLQLPSSTHADQPHRRRRSIPWRPLSRCPLVPPPVAVTAHCDCKSGLKTQCTPRQRFLWNPVPLQPSGRTHPDRWQPSGAACTAVPPASNFRPARTSWESTQPVQLTSPQSRTLPTAPHSTLYRLIFQIHHGAELGGGPVCTVVEF